MNTAMSTTQEDIEGLLASLSAVEAAETAEEAQAAEAVEAVEAVEAAPVAETNEPEVAATATDILDDELLADLDMITARAEAYETQTSEATVADPATIAATTKQTKPKKAKAAGTGTPRQPRMALADLPEDVFVLADGEIVGAQNKADTIAKRPAQKKVAEKFDNLFQSLASGKAPSRYVVIAFKLLQQTGTMTSADLTAAFKTEGMSNGTASSQTGQIMVLFSTVGIANRAGQALTMRADSVIGQKLAALVA